MVATINASVSSSGIVSTADGSGIIKVQSNGVTTNALAWVNFDGTTGTIRSSYNVSSITLDGTGIQTMNFTNALNNANYSVTAMGPGGSTGACIWGIDTGSTPYTGSPTLMTTTQCRLSSRNDAGTLITMSICHVHVFGN